MLVWEFAGMFIKIHYHYSSRKEFQQCSMQQRNSVKFKIFPAGRNKPSRVERLCTMHEAILVSQQASSAGGDTRGKKIFKTIMNTLVNWRFSKDMLEYYLWAK